MAGRRRDLVSDRDWSRSPFVAEHLLPAGLDDCIVAAKVDSAARPSLVHGAVFFRQRSSSSFLDEDRGTVELMQLEIEPLLAPVSAWSGLRLAPRARQTLDLLIAGASDKEIADRLGISRFTVNQYVKLVYRAFRVGSRSQLLARTFSSWAERTR